MEARLYVILGSHACRTGMLMLEHKGIDYRRVTVPTGLHPLFVRLAGFPGSKQPFRRVDGRYRRGLGIADRIGTVPALRMGNERVQTNRAIARFLDEICPEPPLFPAEPDRRREVEEAEAWGDDVFQMAARRIVLTSALHEGDGLANRGADGRLGTLLWKHDRVRLMGAKFIGRTAFSIDADAERRLLASLPEMLDRIDAWIEGGVMNGEQLNAADFMIAPSVALISYREDLRPEIERRSLIGLIDRLLPEPRSDGA